MGGGEQSSGGKAFLTIPLTDKAGPEKFSRGFRRKGVRKRVQGQGGEGAELSSTDESLGVGTFKYGTGGNSKII